MSMCRGNFISEATCSSTLQRTSPKRRDLLIWKFNKGTSYCLSPEGGERGEDNFFGGGHMVHWGNIIVNLFHRISSGFNKTRILTVYRQSTVRSLAAVFSAYQQATMFGLRLMALFPGTAAYYNISSYSWQNVIETPECRTGTFGQE